MSELTRRLEALLFIAARPVSQAELASACEASADDVAVALAELGAEFGSGRRGIELREIGGGFTFAVAGDCEDDVRRLTGAERPDALSGALMETLAVVAYLQPVTRSDVADVRGVSSDWTLAALEQRGLVEQRGRAETPGAPLLYATSGRFMQLFGLSDLSALPDLEEFSLTAADVDALRSRLLANAEERRS